MFLLCAAIVQRSHLYCRVEKIGSGCSPELIDHKPPMSSSLLERARGFHEDLEIYERAIIEQLENKPRTQKVSIIIRAGDSFSLPWVCAPVLLYCYRIVLSRDMSCVSGLVDVWWVVLRRDRHLQKRCVCVCVCWSSCPCRRMMNTNACGVGLCYPTGSPTSRVTGHGTIDVSLCAW